MDSLVACTTCAKSSPRWTTPFHPGFSRRPLTLVGSPGHGWTGDVFEDVKRSYYRMMGWTDDGVPRFETLIDHRIEWATDAEHE